MAKKVKRRDFIKKSTHIGLSAAVSGSIFSHIVDSPIVRASSAEQVDVSVVSGSDYVKSTVRAVELLGGMKNFVPENSKVVVFPNSQSRNPGTYTKPEIVRAVINMCIEAGAGEVNCLTCMAEEYWEATRLKEAVQEAGGKVTNFEGKTFQIYKDRHIVASNGKLHKKIIGAMK